MYTSRTAHSIKAQSLESLLYRESTLYSSYIQQQQQQAMTKKKQKKKNTRVIKGSSKNKPSNNANNTSNFSISNIEEDNFHNFEDWNYAKQFELTSNLVRDGTNNHAFEHLEEFCHYEKEKVGKKNERLRIPVSMLQNQVDAISCECCKFMTNKRGLEVALRDGACSLALGGRSRGEDKGSNGDDNHDYMDDLESGIAKKSISQNGMISLVRVADEVESDNLTGDAFCSLENSMDQMFTPQFIKCSVEHLNQVCNANYGFNSSSIDPDLLSRCHRGFIQNILPTHSFINVIQSLSDDCRNTRQLVQKRREEWFYKLNQQKSSPWTRTLRNSTGQEFDPSVALYFRLDESMKEWFSALTKVVLTAAKYHNVLQIPDINDSSELASSFHGVLAPMLLTISSGNDDIGFDDSHDYQDKDQYLLTSEHVSSLWTSLERAFVSLHESNLKYRNDSVTSSGNSQLCFSSTLRSIYAEVLRAKYDTLQLLHSTVVEYSKAVVECRKFDLSKVSDSIIEVDNDPRSQGYSQFQDDNPINTSASIVNLKYCDKILWSLIESPQFDTVGVKELLDDFSHTLLNCFFDTPHDKKCLENTSSNVIKREKSVLVALKQMRQIFEALIGKLEKEYRNDKSRNGSVYFIPAITRLGSMCDNIHIAQLHLKIDRSDPCSMLSLLSHYYRYFQLLIAIKTLDNIKSSLKKGKFCSINHKKNLRFEALVTLNMCSWFERRYNVWRAHRAEQELLQDLLASETSTTSKQEFRGKSTKKKKKRKKFTKNDSKTRCFEKNPDSSSVASISSSSSTCTEDDQHKEVNDNFILNSNRKDITLDNGVVHVNTSSSSEYSSDIGNDRILYPSPSPIADMKCNPQDLQTTNLSHIDIQPDRSTSKISLENNKDNNSGVAYFFGDFETEYSYSNTEKFDVRLPTSKFKNPSQTITLAPEANLEMKEEKIESAINSDRRPTNHPPKECDRHTRDDSESNNFDYNTAYEFLMDRFASLYEKEYDVNISGQRVPIIRF